MHCMVVKVPLPRQHSCSSFQTALMGYFASLETELAGRCDYAACALRINYKNA